MKANLKLNGKPVTFDTEEQRLVVGTICAEVLVLRRRILFLYVAVFLLAVMLVLTSL